MKSLRTTTNRKRFSKKWLIVAAVAVLLIGGTVAGYYVYSRPKDTGKSNAISSSDNNSERTVNYQAPSKDEQTAGEAQKEQTVNNKPDAPSNSDRDTSNSGTLDVTLTAVNQNGATVQIRSLISQIITGTCTLTVSRGDITKTYNANTQADASSSTCKGFDVPVSDLQPGNWSIKLAVSSADNKKGETTTSLEVK